MKKLLTLFLIVSLSSFNLFAFVPSSYNTNEQTPLNSVLTSSALLVFDMATFKGVSSVYKVGEEVATGGKFTTEANQAYFWSGLGDGGKNIASNIATERGGITLEKFIQNNGIKLPEYNPKNLESVKAWQEASKAYAQGAQGSVRVVLGDTTRPTSIWNTIELPALKANQKVTEIIQVNPKTGIETVIFKR